MEKTRGLIESSLLKYSSCHVKSRVLKCKWLPLNILLNFFNHLNDHSWWLAVSQAFTNSQIRIGNQKQNIVSNYLNKKHGKRRQKSLIFNYFKLLNRFSFHFLPVWQKMYKQLLKHARTETFRNVARAVNFDALDFDPFTCN